MTLEEFQEFAKGQIEKAKKAEKKAWEARERRLDNTRYKGMSRDFIDEEDGHWIVVKDNQIVERCDTKGEAWRALWA